MKIILTIIILLTPIISVSQDNDSVTVEDIEGRLDFTIPETPAFSIIGASTDNVIEAGTPSSFAINVLTSDDDLGNGQSGLAISFRPYFLWLAPKTSLKNISKHAIFNSLSFSYIDTKGTDINDETKRKGIGIRFSLLDSTDPLRKNLKGAKKIHECIKNKKKETFKKLGDELVDVEAKIAVVDSKSIEYINLKIKEKEIESKINKLKNKHFSDKCLVEFKNENGYKTPNQLQVGLAFHKSNVNDLDITGNSIWSSYSHPLYKEYYLTSHLRFGKDIIQATNDEDNPYKSKRQPNHIHGKFYQLLFGLKFQGRSFS